MRPRARTRLGVVVTLALMLGAAPSAHAQLTGGTVGLQYRFPDPGSVVEDLGTAVVGPGTEFPTVLGGIASVNVTDNLFILTFNGDATFPPGLDPTPFSGFLFFDAGLTLSPFTGAALDGTTNFVFDPNRILATGDLLFVEMGGLTVTQGSVLAIEIQQSVVPEPATVALLGTGLLGLGVFARRRRA